MDTREQILRARAIQAAKKTVSREEEEGIDVVCFTIGDEKYAIDAILVAEVHIYVQPTAVPHVPPYIKGIIYIRGRFVSLVNLKTFLGIQQEGSKESRSILLLSEGTREFGVEVDDVMEETKVSNRLIQSISPGFNLHRKDLIAGVTEEGIILLDGKKFIGDSAMQIYQEVTTSLIGRENV